MKWARDHPHPAQDLGLCRGGVAIKKTGGKKGKDAGAGGGQDTNPACAIAFVHRAPVAFVDSSFTFVGGAAVTFVTRAAVTIPVFWAAVALVSSAPVTITLVWPPVTVAFIWATVTIAFPLVSAGRPLPRALVRPWIIGNCVCVAVRAAESIALAVWLVTIAAIALAARLEAIPVAVGFEAIASIAVPVRLEAFAVCRAVLNVSVVRAGRSRRVWRSARLGLLFELDVSARNNRLGKRNGNGKEKPRC